MPESTLVNQRSDENQDPPTQWSSGKPIKIKASEKIGASLNDLGQKLSNTMADWAQSIFGRDDEFKKDYESTELEAYLAYDLSLDLPLKVPFGHRRLQYGLKRVMNKKNNGGLTTFDRFTGSSSFIHRLLDDVSREANRMQKRERTLITYKIFASARRPYYLIAFFSIQPEKKPIAFKDAFGREYSLPFELCKNWQVSKLISC